MSSFYYRATLVLALLVPVVALPTRDGSSIVSYTFAALALVVFLTYGLKNSHRVQWGDTRFIAVVFLCPFLSMCLTSAYYGIWSGSEVEKMVRIALSIGVYWLLIQIPAAALKRVQWALMAAAATGSIMLLYIVKWSGLGRGAVTRFGADYNAVALANLTLLFGISALLMLGWQLSRWPRIEKWLKVAVAALSVHAVLVSQTRSSWMLIPIFAFIVVLLARCMSKRLRRTLIIGGVAVLLAAVVVVPEVNHRMDSALSNVVSYENGKRNTSVGIRMQLWIASWKMGSQNMLLGVTAPAFRPELEKMAKKGIVTPVVAEGWGEPHSDLAGAFAAYGLLGFFAMLALFLAPAVVFLRRIRDPIPRIRTAASLGLLLCLGYTAFSLTEMMFRGMRSVTVYTIILAIFMAMTRHDGADNLAQDESCRKLPSRAGTRSLADESGAGSRRVDH
jgi:O-antigen ligase